MDFTSEKNIIEKIIWFLGKKAFVIVLLLVIIDVVIGTFVFYEFVFVAEKQEPKVVFTLKFKDNDYKTVLSQWKQESQNSQQSGVEIFPNPFGIAPKTK
jgi:nitrate/TMAO reductase-like tetraheme cytochrome c subunit